MDQITGYTLHLAIERMKTVGSIWKSASMVTLLPPVISLTFCRVKIIESLRHLPNAPSVAQHEIPPDLGYYSDEDSEDEDPDERVSMRARDRYVQKDNELSDSDEEDDRRNIVPLLFFLSLLCVLTLQIGY